MVDDCMMGSKRVMLMPLDQRRGADDSVWGIDDVYHRY